MTTPPPSRPTRRNVPFTVTDDHPVTRIASATGDADLPAGLTSMLNRYLHLIHRNPPKVSDRELCAIIDALGDTWPGQPHQVHSIHRDVIPTIISDRLDAKWAIDAAQLRTRLERSTAADRTSLAEFVINYWLLTSEGEAPQVTLQRVKDLLQPSSTVRSDPPRPRKIYPLLFDQAETGTTETSTPGTDDEPAHSPDSPDNDDGADEGQPTGHLHNSPPRTIFDVPGAPHAPDASGTAENADPA